MQSKRDRKNIDDFFVASNHIQLIRLAIYTTFVLFLRLCLFPTSPSLSLAGYLPKSVPCTQQTSDCLLVLILNDCCWYFFLLSSDSNPDFFKVIAAVAVVVTDPFIAYFISIKRLYMALKC